jgi:hypothetical protein
LWFKWGLRCYVHAHLSIHPIKVYCK